MNGWISGELLLYGGIGLMALSAGAAAVSALVLRAAGRRLKAQLDAEFGRQE